MDGAKLIVKQTSHDALLPIREVRVKVMGPIADRSRRFRRIAVSGNARRVPRIEAPARIVQEKEVPMKRALTAITAALVLSLSTVSVATAQDTGTDVVEEATNDDGDTGLFGLLGLLGLAGLFG